MQLLSHIPLSTNFSPVLYFILFSRIVKRLRKQQTQLKLTKNNNNNNKKQTKEKQFKGIVTVIKERNTLSQKQGKENEKFHNFSFSQLSMELNAYLSIYIGWEKPLLNKQVNHVNLSLSFLFHFFIPKLLFSYCYFIPTRCIYITPTSGSIYI